MQKDAFLLQDLLCKWIQYSVATYMGPSNAETPMEVTGSPYSCIDTLCQPVPLQPPVKHVHRKQEQNLCATDFRYRAVVG